MKIFLCVLLIFWSLICTVGFLREVKKVAQLNSLLDMWKDGAVWCDSKDKLEKAVKDGRNCFFPAGTRITLSSPINIPSGVKWEGTGDKATWFRVR